MSFLNPVNEPVQRFSSKDADAPQINYAARTAGDVKTVLKACLVTGYGAKAGAGWSIVNEVGHVAEFVSPSAAMSDYRLGIDDSSAANTTWYYQYQDARTNPRNNATPKSMREIVQGHANSEWELLVTALGLYFLEHAQHSAVQAVSSRLTYIGATKSALLDTAGVNIAFYNIGHTSAINEPVGFYNNSYGAFFAVGAYRNMYPIDSTPLRQNQGDILYGVSAIILTSPVYLTSATNDLVVAQLSGLLTQINNTSEQAYGKNEVLINARPALQISLGYDTSSAKSARSRARTVLIYLDYWEY